MLITDMKVTPIAVADPPLLNAAGLHAPYALRIVLELITEDQIYGLGEVPGNDKTLKALESARQVVVGKDPFHLNHIQSSLVDHFGPEGSETRGEAPWDQRRLVHVFSAIEVACFDVMGKVTGRPVVDLLGGRTRDQVPFSAYLFYKYEGSGGNFSFDIDPHATGWVKARQAETIDPKGIVKQAEAMCQEFGFDSIKLKGGAFEPEIEVDSIKALRRSFGDAIPLRLDPNAIWSVDTAIKWGREMEGLLEYYEDPVRGQTNMATVKKAVQIPLATNMCTTSFKAIPSSIRLQSEDIILSDHHFWGGLRASVELGRICQTFGLGLSMHSNSHVGISLMAMSHLAAAIPNLTYACDTHYPWQSEEVITGGRLQIEDGALTVPNSPGLGIELDREALARLHQQYLDCGLTERNDAIEMKKIIPDWTFQSVRW